MKIYWTEKFQKIKQSTQKPEREIMYKARESLVIFYNMKMQFALEWHHLISREREKERDNNTSYWASYNNNSSSQNLKFDALKRERKLFITLVNIAIKVWNLFFFSLWLRWCIMISCGVLQINAFAILNERNGVMEIIHRSTNENCRDNRYMKSFNLK